jgi:hypothetical protein
MRAPSAATLLHLGRISNLPTVWTNVLAASVLAGADPFGAPVGWALAAMTLFYVGGMYLNDAFDRDIDARERPNRPIPSGRISARTVFGLGFGMLALAALVMAAHGAAAALTAAALAGAIVAYDLRHKGNPWSPMMMGLCRLLVYVGAATMVGEVTGAVLVGAIALFAHVVGLTYTAKQESLDRIDRLWPLAVLAVPLVLALPGIGSGLVPIAAFALLALADGHAVARLRTRAPGAVQSSVGALIAAICLVDALVIAAYAPALAALCVGFYVVTRLLHRIVPGT